MSVGTIGQDLKDVFGPKLTAGIGESPGHTHFQTSTEQFERKMGLAVCSREVVKAVDDLCETLPATQLPALATKVGFN